MKRIFAIVILGLFLACDTAPKDSFTIQVNAPNVYNGIHAHLKGLNEKGRLFIKDSAIVFNETFVINGKRDEPSLEYLFIDGCNGYLPIIIENAEIKVDINKDSLITSIISGTKNNEAYQDYYFTEKKLTDSYKKLTSKFKQATLDNSPDKEDIYKRLTQTKYQIEHLAYNYIKKHQNTFLALILLYDNVLNNKIELDEARSIFENFSEELKNSTYGKKITEKFDTLETT